MEIGKLFALNRLKHISKFRSMFTLVRNSLTGKMDWAHQTEDYDFAQEIARSGYADMLHDEERNRLYNEAIRKTVAHVANAKKNIKVVDIGTGTSLLSMMAVKAGRYSGAKVVVDAYECFEPMAKCAERVLKRNGFTEDDIKVFHMRSDQRDPQPCEEEKADVLVTELFDTECIGEGAIGAYRHALDTLMNPGALAVPYKARIWIQVVNSATLFKSHQFTSIKIARQENSDIVINPPDQVLRCGGSNILHDVQLSQYTPGVDFEVITKPRVAFEFNFTDRNTLPLDDCNLVEFELLKDVVDAKLTILFWWDMLMDWEGEIILSCAPYWAHPSGLPASKLPWREHWIQAIYHLPAFSSQFIGEKGSTLRIYASHDDFSFSFDRKKRDANYCSCGIHNHISRPRMSVLNDEKQLKIYLDTVMNVLQSKQGANSNVLFIGEMSYLPLAIAKSNSSITVYCFSKKASDVDFYSIFSKNNDIKNLKLYDQPDEIPSDVKMDIVLSEPYFGTFDLPWDLLHFWYNASKLPASLLNSDATVIPNRVQIKAIPVQFDHLWKIRAPVESTQGLNIEEFDSLILQASDSSDELIESQPLREYPGIALSSEPIKLFDWDYPTFIKLIESDREFVRTESDLNFDRSVLSFQVNQLSLAFWIEFSFEGHLILNTGPIEPFAAGSYCSWHGNWKQGVAFLRHSAIPATELSQKIFAHYSLKSGKMSLPIA